MPETGEAELPMRADDPGADGDEKEAEDDDEQGGSEVGEWSDVGAGDGLELEEEEHDGDQGD